MEIGVSSIRVKPEHVEDIAVLLHGLPDRTDLLATYTPFEDDFGDWADDIFASYGLSISEPNKKSPYVIVNIKAFDEDLTTVALHTIAPYIIDGSELEWFFKENLFAELSGYKKFKYKNGVMTIHPGHVVIVYDEKKAEPTGYQKIQMVPPVEVDNPFEDNDEEKDNPFVDAPETYASKISKLNRRRKQYPYPDRRRRLTGGSK